MPSVACGSAEYRRRGMQAIFNFGRAGLRTKQWIDSARGVEFLGFRGEDSMRLAFLSVTISLALGCSVALAQQAPDAAAGKPVGDTIGHPPPLAGPPPIPEPPEKTPPHTSHFRASDKRTRGERLHGSLCAGRNTADPILHRPIAAVQRGAGIEHDCARRNFHTNGQGCSLRNSGARDRWNDDLCGNPRSSFKKSKSGATSALAGGPARSEARCRAVGCSEDGGLLRDARDESLDRRSGLGARHL